MIVLPSGLSHRFGTFLVKSRRRHGGRQRTNKNDRNYGCFHAQLGPKIGPSSFRSVTEKQTGIKYLRNCPPIPPAYRTWHVSHPGPGDQTAHFSPSPRSSANPKLVTNLTNFTTNPRATLEHRRRRCRKNPLSSQDNLPPPKKTVINDTS